MNLQEDMESKSYLKKQFWDGKIVDVHCHFFPQQLFNAIWEYFEQYAWNITYKGTPEELAKQLTKMGVRYFSVLNYAHKPGIAENINRWTEMFSTSHEGALPFFTIYPEDPGNHLMAEQLLTKGFTGIKLQPLVQKFHVADDRINSVYETIIKYNAWAMLHTGTAPYSNGLVGVKYFRELMKKFPDLNVIVAHMGGYEFDDFFELLEIHPNMRLDTTMIFTQTDVFDTSFPDRLIDRFIHYRDRIFFGSDFPNIPYGYEESINGLLRLGLEKNVYENVFYKNAKRDLNLEL